MLSVSAGDIIKVLEKLPVWKQLTNLLREVEDLRTRVAALEKEVARRPALERCALCQGEMKVTKSAPSREHGAIVQIRTLVCTECGHSEQRVSDPSGIMGTEYR